MTPGERQEQLKADFQAVMSLAAGRRVIWWFIDGVCGVHSGGFTGEALSTAFAEGRRDVGLKLLLKAQEWAPQELVHAIVEEFREREAAALAAQQNADEDE